jgi:hypothetical protein
VTLGEAVSPPNFMKKRLRLMGESYCVYFRGTNKVNEQHVEALNESSQAVINLLKSVSYGNIDQLSDVEARESGKYDGGK